ncbi:MAG: tetratricopeptide repeat protein [Flavitalea sp.]
MFRKLVLPVLLVLYIQANAQTESTFNTAKKAYQDDNYAESLKLFDKASKEEPQNAQVPYFIGRVYLEISNYKQSAVFLEKAIAMDSSRANWIYECALVYYAIPDYKRSLQFMELAGVKGYKKTNDYLENLGNAYINVNQFQKGIDLLNEVLKKKPADPELLYQVGQAYFKATKYQEAIVRYDQVLTLDKTNAEALYMIGLCYQKKGETQKGQQLCDKAIEMDPSLRSKREKKGGDL